MLNRSFTPCELPLCAPFALPDDKLSSRAKVSKGLLIERFKGMANFDTADLCDDHNDKVQVLEAGFQHFGSVHRCQGTIVTVKLEKHNGDLITLLRDQDGTGKIVVVDVDAAYYAVVGENLMKFAHQNGYAGILINGYVRDTAHITDIPVALIALGTCPRKYMQPLPGSCGDTLDFAGVTFTEGAYLYADGDGVIVTDKALL